MNSIKLKETIANIVKEESEYQIFFRKALEKAGKSIPSMSDEEKKAFFNKIDATWDGKGEKNEGNAFGAAVVAAKKAGEDEFEVGGKTFKVEESVNESHFKVGDKVKMSHGGVGVVKSLDKEDGADDEKYYGVQLPNGEIHKHSPNELSLVNEGVSPKDMDKIKGAVEAASSFMSVGSELKKLGMKYTFATEPLPIYIIQPTPNNKVAIVNKKYATKPDFVVGDIAVGIMEGKLNEEEIKWNAVQNAIINFLKMNTKILDKRVQAKDTDGVKGGLKSIINGLTNAQRSLKLESVSSVNEATLINMKNIMDAQRIAAKSKLSYEDSFDAITAYLVATMGLPKALALVLKLEKEHTKLFESVNEAIAVGKMVKVVDNPHWEAALGKKGPFKRKVKMIDGDNVFFTDGSNSSMKYVKESVSSVNEEKYTIIDPKGNSMGAAEKTQVMLTAKKKGGEKAGYFVVSAKNALKAKRALEKFKGDFKNPKLKDMMSDLYFESVNEGRAFINAARKAKLEGKTEFEFNGKKYPVTIKD